MWSSCWYISMLKWTRIDCYSNKKTNFREIYSIFHEKFCLILPQNRQFDLELWKSPNKKCKCGNLWQKVKCARYGKQTWFLFFFLTFILYDIKHALLYRNKSLLKPHKHQKDMKLELQLMLYIYVKINELYQQRWRHLALSVVTYQDFDN